MGLFDRFKKKDQGPTSPAYPKYEEAKAAYEKGDYQLVLSLLMGAFREDIDFKPLYQLSLEALEKLGGKEESELFRQVLQNFDSFDAFFNLGHHFFMQDHMGMAQPMLNKAHQIQADHIENAHLLAIVLARRFQIEKAIQVLQIDNLEEEFWAYYFRQKCLLLYASPEGVHQYATETLAYLQQQESNPILEEAKGNMIELLEIEERLTYLPQPKPHIRDWHFIQYGGIILDYFDETEDYVAGGRFVASWGSLEGLKKNILQLNYCLRQLKLSISRISALADRDSQIIGQSIALELDLPFSTYQKEAIPNNALIIAGETSSFNDCKELLDINNGNILYALCHDWLNSSFLSPDIIGFMAQAFYFPWHGGGFKVEEESGETIRTMPDNRVETEIAIEIHSLEVEETDWRELLGFYSYFRDYLKASQSQGMRFNFMIESPVPGSFFGQ